MTQLNPLYSLIAGMSCTTAAFLFSGLLPIEVETYFFPIITGIMLGLSIVAFCSDMAGER